MPADLKEIIPIPENKCDSQNIINDLPEELLSSIFDHLQVDSRLAAQTTCRRWAEVLSSPRFLRDQVVSLMPELTRTEDATVLGLFPAVSISVYSDTVQKFRKYFSDEIIAQTLEELHLDGSDKSLGVFLTCKEGLHLPNLRKLKICCPLNLESEITLVAPNLKCVAIESEEEGHFGGFLAQPFFDRVEELVVSLPNETASFSLDRFFPYLRLVKVEGHASLIRNENFPRLTSRLTKLECRVSDRTPKSVSVKDSYKPTLWLSTETLDLGCLHRLTNLRELILDMDGLTYELPSIIRIHLPNLTKLHAAIGLAPSFISKNLRILHVNVVEPINERKVKAYFKTIRRHLQVASFDFSSSWDSKRTFVVELIQTLTELRRLTISNAYVRQLQLKQWLVKLKLRKISLLDCSMSLRDLGYYTKEEYGDFAVFQAQHPDCVINIPVPEEPSLRSLLEKILFGDSFYD